MHKTVLVKLKVQAEAETRLLATFADYKLAWQHVSDWVYQNKTRNRFKVHAETYREIRNKLPNLNSGLVQQARNDAIAKFSSIASNKHKISAAPKLKNVSLRFDNRTSTLVGNVLSLAVNGGRIRVELESFPFLEKHRAYKTLAPLVFRRNKDFYVALTFDTPVPESKSGGIMGIDLGLRILAATSEGKLIRGAKMNRLRRKSRFLKAELQRKGTKSSKRHLRRLRGKEKRQSRDVIHCSVNEVLKTSAAILAVEKLDLRAKKHRKDSNRRRFSVPLSAFLTILQYKAKAKGKQVVEVSPCWTSQDDCRGLSPGIRSGGKYTGIDGRVLHADINAACNIALKAKSAYKLDNPALCVYSAISGQADVNQPIACKSPAQVEVLQASTALA